MISESAFYDLRSRVALIEADNPTGKTFQPFDEGRGTTFIPEGGSGEAVTFSFNGKKTGALEFSIQPGAIELGPDTVIESGSITGYSITQTIPEGNTSWYVWVNVDVTDGAEAAEMFTGSSITALTSEEKKHIRQKRIIQVAIVDDVITTVKNLQCGNIDIPRL
jgi:hypothetical protein